MLLQLFLGHHEATAVLSEFLDHSSYDDIIDAVHEALAMHDELF